MFPKSAEPACGPKDDQTIGNSSISRARVLSKIDDQLAFWLLDGVGAVQALQALPIRM